MDDKSTAQDSNWVSLGRFGAWIAACLLIALDVFYVFEAFQSILGAIQGAHQTAFQQAGGIGVDLQVFYTLGAMDYAILLVLGVAAVSAAIAVEYYFRKGQLKGLLLKRVGIILGSEVAVIVVSILIRIIMIRIQI